MKVRNGLDLQAQNIVNLADPAAAQDAATKAYVDANGGGGLAQIGSALATTSGTTAAFTDIPATHSHLLIELLGISHNGGGSQQLRIELSPDGVNWTAPASILSSIAGSVVVYGSFPILGYRRGAGSVAPTYGSLAADNSLGSIGGTAFSWRISAGIAALRFAWSGGASFDAGEIKLHGF